MKKNGELAYGVACVYRIVNTQTGKQYVGSTTRFDYRFREHRRMLRYGCHHSVHLQRSWDKHGEEAFRFELVKVVHGFESLIEEEQKEIDRLGKHRLYNQSLVAGRAIVGRPVWLINAATGLKTQFSSTFHAAVEVLRDPRKLCAITKAARSGNTLVSSFATIADAADYYHVSPGAIGNAMRGCGYRTAAGLEWSSIKTAPQKMNKKTKPVCQIESGKLVKVWESAREAAMSITGVTYRGISDAALGRSKSHRGYQWEYVKN